MKIMEKEYLANRILNANDTQLVELLYEGFIATSKSAIDHIENKDIENLTRAANKDREILTELLATLDGNSEIANNLRQLYIYLNKLVTEAEVKRDKSKLEEAIRVATPLYEAWKELGDKEDTELSNIQSANTSVKMPSIVAGMTYGKGQLNDYVINDGDRWEKG